MYHLTCPCILVKGKSVGIIGILQRITRIDRIYIGEAVTVGSKVFDGTVLQSALVSLIDICHTCNKLVILTVFTDKIPLVIYIEYFSGVAVNKSCLTVCKFYFCIRTRSRIAYPLQRCVIGYFHNSHNTVAVGYRFGFLFIRVIACEYDTAFTACCGHSFIIYAVIHVFVNADNNPVHFTRLIINTKLCQLKPAFEQITACTVNNFFQRLVLSEYVTFTYALSCQRINTIYLVGDPLDI